MKNFLIIILSFLLVVVGLDIVFGKMNMMLEAKAHTSNYHCMYEASEDVLILGSSYAVREVVPQVMTEKTGLSCYNAGEAGNGALCAWIRYNMFVRNHVPKVILYALTPGFDYVEMGSTYNEYLKSFRAYYDVEPSVKEMYDDLGEEYDHIRLRSAFVRYNSEWLPALLRLAMHKNSNTSGYDPFDKVFTPYEKPDTAGTEDVRIDEKKFRYFERLMRDAISRSIKVVCFLPPHYYNTYHAQSHERALDLCRELSIPVIDSYNDCYYQGRPALFGDKDHLNHQGALLYTAQLADSIQSHLWNNMSSRIFLNSY